MTKKKRGHPTAEEVLARPWCYYCERDFDDLKILISHQKAKHFKCERCGRRLNTAGGLSVHMTQVHKENLEAVENALPNRSGLNVEIFGMEGIPEDVVQQHNQRVLAQFHQAEADRRAATGNPAPGGASAAAVKKPKIEDTGDLKSRLAAFRAKKAAGGTATTSGDSTPTATVAPDVNAAPAADAPQSPAQYQFNQHPPQGSSTQASFQQSHGSSGYGFAQQQQQQHPYPQSNSPFNPTSAGFAPPVQAPPVLTPYQPHHQTPYYGATSPPPGMFQQNSTQAASTVQNGSFPRPPGLPQRPMFGVPQTTPAQMQQMHQGQYPAQPTETNNLGQDPHIRPSTDGQATATEADVDNLIANAAKQSTNPQSNELPPGDKSNDKSKKKDKDKPTKLVYEDNEVSPEEKMAKLSRYAFDPSDQKPETAIGDAVVATVTGPVVGENDVLDTQG